MFGGRVKSEETQGGTGVCRLLERGGGGGSLLYCTVSFYFLGVEAIGVLTVVERKERFDYSVQ